MFLIYTARNFSKATWRGSHMLREQRRSRKTSGSGNQLDLHGGYHVVNRFSCLATIPRHQGCAGCCMLHFAYRHVKNGWISDTARLKSRERLNPIICLRVFTYLQTARGTRVVIHNLRAKSWLYIFYRGWVHRLKVARAGPFSRVATDAAVAHKGFVQNSTTSQFQQL